jgi:glycosyl transferase family 25
MENNLSVFIISLKNDSERREHMSVLCSNFGFKAIIIEATDGRLLSSDYVNSIYSKHKALENIGRELSRSEIGCALSHKKIYIKMIDENIEQALILEDDVEFDNSLRNVLTKASIIAKKWDVILLGHHTGESRQIDTRASYWGKIKIASNLELARPCERAYGTYGYLISLTGAKKISNKLDSIQKPIDHYTGDDTLSNLYIINSAPIKIHGDLSENFNSMEEREKLDKRHATLLISKKDSLKKRTAKYLGIYHLLVNLNHHLRMFVKMMKPLRKYK